MTAFVWGICLIGVFASSVVTVWVIHRTFDREYRERIHALIAHLHDAETKFGLSCTRCRSGLPCAVVRPPSLPPAPQEQLHRESEYR